MLAKVFEPEMQFNALSKSAFFYIPEDVMMSVMLSVHSNFN